MNEHSPVFDADPTGLADIRDGLEREVTRRWVTTARDVKRALIQHDALGIGDKAPQLAMPTADKAHLFRRWLDEKLMSGVAGYDGLWLEPHLDQASKRGVGRVVLGDAGPEDEPRDESGRWTSAAQAHDVPSGQRDPSRPVYLRIGAWAPKEQSLNYAKGEIEAGVSVYELDHKGDPVVPAEGEWAEDDLHDRMRGTEPKFLVQGDLVGEGGDGEPLLKGVKVVGLHKAHREIGDAQQNLDFLVARRPPSADACHAASVGHLATICEETSELAHGAVAAGLLQRARPGRIAKLVDQAMGHGLKRTRALAEHAVTQAYSQATLDALEASGVTMVGTLSEHRRKLRDFDPGEPRDDQGRWTAGSTAHAGYAFVSPNVGNIGFSEAKAALQSHRESMLLEASTDVDHAVGAFGITSAVIGAWADGAEHSTMTVVDHADWDTLRLAAAIKGHLADQKQVLIFKEADSAESGENRNAMLYSFEAQGDLGAIHQRLLDDGVAFHTLQPKSDGATVWIADTEHSQETAATVGKAAHGARVDVREGRAEFLGTSQDTGTDREQRDSARRAYEGVIAESPVQGAQALWQGLHHRWGQALAQVVDGLFAAIRRVLAERDDGSLETFNQTRVNESVNAEIDDEGEDGDDVIVVGADGRKYRVAKRGDEWAVYAADAARKTPQPKHPRSGQFAKAHVVARERRRSKRTGQFRRQGLSPEEQRKEELTEARFGRVMGRLDVQTQGDDRVCDVCDEISANGPYGINHARSLIPAHPNCRCLFVAAGTMQDAWIEDFDPDEPRNEKGEWTGGGGFTLYHGSGHELAQFDMSKIGTGEGSQVYGHGFYLARNPEVAKSYESAGGAPSFEVDGKGLDVGNDVNRFAASLLSTIHPDGPVTNDDLEFVKSAAAKSIYKSYGPGIADTVGSWLGKNFKALGQNLYTVKVHADPDQFLDWDKPLSQQSKLVQDYVKNRDVGGAFARRRTSGPTPMEWDPTGSQMMQGFIGMGPHGAARLQEAGIKGVRYMDAGSRLSGDAEGMVKNYGTREKALAVARERYQKASLGDIRYWSDLVNKLGKPLTHNYVVVDPSILEVTHKNGRALTKAQARDAMIALFDFDPGEPRDESGKWTTGASAPDLSTLEGRNAAAEAVVKKHETLGGALSRIFLGKSEPREPKPDPTPPPGWHDGLKLYHGTSLRAANDILAHGLISHASEGGDAWAQKEGMGLGVGSTEGGRAISVYMTNDADYARKFASFASKLGKSTPVLFEVDVPSDQAKNLKQDEESETGRGYRYEGNIPPSWIHLVPYKTKTGIETMFEGGDAEPPTRVYMVIFADEAEDVADFSPDEPRDPQGRWTALSGSQGHQALISTRPVTAVGKNEEERTAALAAKGVYKTIDLAAMKLDKEKFKDNVDLFRDARFYPGMQTSETQAKVKTDDLAKVIVERLKSNLKFLVGQQTKEFIKTNKRWYDGAHKLAGKMSKDSGVDIASASGVIAALSPQTDWDRNVYMAHAVADSLTHRMDFAWDDAMEKTGTAIWTKDNAQFLPALRNAKTLRELSKGADQDAAHALMGMWIRTYDQAHGSRNYHAITAEGDEGDFVRVNAPEGRLGAPKIMMWGTVSSIGNAVAAYRSGGDANKLSDAMGDRHKVRSFYNNILDPDSANGDVTIDTHAVGAAWLQPYTGKDVAVLHALNTSPEAKFKPEGWVASKGSSVTGVKGTYGLYAQAYREAAHDLGMKPRELQSVVWVAKREMFAEDQTGSVMKHNIDQVWRDFHSGEIDIEAAQKQVMKVAKETKGRAK